MEYEFVSLVGEKVAERLRIIEDYQEKLVKHIDEIKRETTKKRTLLINASDEITRHLFELKNHSSTEEYEEAKKQKESLEVEIGHAYLEFEKKEKRYLYIYDLCERLKQLLLKDSIILH